MLDAANTLFWTEVAAVGALASAVASMVTVFFYWFQFKHNREAENQRLKLDRLQQNAALWNSLDMIEARNNVAKYIDAIPTNEHARTWLEKNHPQEKWSLLSFIAHHLAHVESLAESDLIDKNVMIEVYGAAGWWARKLEKIYATMEDEWRVSRALHSLGKRFPLLSTQKFARDLSNIRLSDEGANPLPRYAD